MLNFISRTYYKSKLAIFDSSPPEDEALIAINTLLTSTLQQVESLKVALVKHMESHRIMNKTSQAVVNNFERFFTECPVQATVSAVDAYSRVGLMLENSSLALFEEGMQTKVWSKIDAWMEQHRLLKQKLSCLNQARVLLYAKKYEVRTIQENRDTKLSKNEIVTPEEDAHMKEEMAMLAYQGTAVDHMHKIVLLLAAKTVQPNGFYTTFDEVFMNFIHFQSRFFSSATQLTSSYQPIIDTFRDTLKIRETMSEARNDDDDDNEEKSEEPLLSWNDFSSGEAALEELAKQVRGDVPEEEVGEGGNKDVVEGDEIEKQDENNVNNKEEKEENNNNNNINNNTSENKKQVITASTKKEQQEQQSEKQQEKSQKQSQSEDQQEKELSWSDKVSKWEDLSNAPDLIQLLQTLPLLLLPNMDWKHLTKRESDDFGEVSKCYRKAIAIFSPYKAKPDSVSEEDFKLVTGSVTTTLKKAYMKYRQDHA